MKTRVISAVIAIAILIPLYLLGGIPFTVAICLVAAQAFREITNLKESHKPFSPMITLFGLIGLELIILINFNSQSMIGAISLLAISLIFLCLLIPSIYDEKGKYTTRDALYLIGIILFLGIFFKLLLIFRLSDKWLLLYLILVAVVTDIFAYVIGTLIGKHKVMPKVSPKKSIEGCIGGAILGTAVGSIFYATVLVNDINIILLIFMTLILSILGQLGDLFFSKMKRENEIKDFSNIMPGHGGILDRLDSITFIVYGYVIIYMILNLL